MPHASPSAALSHPYTPSRSSPRASPTSTPLGLCPSTIGPPLQLLRNNRSPPGLSTPPPPTIRIVTSLSCQSPRSPVSNLASVQPSAELSTSSTRIRALRRMSSTGTRLNLNSPFPAHSGSNTLLSSPFIGSRRHNPFGLQLPVNHSSEIMVIGGECGLADGGTSDHGRPPSSKKWIAHHLSAVLQHSFSVSSLHPITSVSTSPSHYSTRQAVSVLPSNTSVIPADQLRNRASLTSLSSFTDSITTDEDDEDERVEAESSTSSTESFLQASDSDPFSASILDPTLPSNFCRSQLASTPRQCATCTLDFYDPPPKGHSRPILLKLLDTWSFDANSLSSFQIRQALHVLLSTYLKYTPGFIDILAQLGISEPEKCLASLVDNLEMAYDPRNAYHNFRHAVDVVQAVYTMLSHQGVVPPLSWVLRVECGESGLAPWQRNPVGRVGRALDEVTVWGLLLAAAGHDVGHPGLSNAFMVNARTPISHVFSDGSVLENFHRITFTRMLREHGFRKLVDDHPGFRQVIAGDVLATDMGRHFPIVEQLKALGARWANEAQDQTTAEATLDEKVLITAGLIKCGDISNSSRPHHISLTWSSCLLNEWSRQAALENDLHLPVSVVTLDPAEKRAQAKSQIGFTTLFVLPLFSVMEALSPVAFKPFASSCRLGLKTWQKVVEHIDAHNRAASPIRSSASTAALTLQSIAPPRMAPRPAAEEDPDLVSPTKTTHRVSLVSFTSTPTSTLPLISSVSTSPPRASVINSNAPCQHPSIDLDCTTIATCLSEDTPSDDQSPADDHLTPKPAQRGWWASSPSPPATPNSISPAFTQLPPHISSTVVSLPSDRSSQACSSQSPTYPLSRPGSVSRGFRLQNSTIACDNVGFDAQDVPPVMPSDRASEHICDPCRPLTITLPATVRENSNTDVTFHHLDQPPSPDNRKTNSGADDSSFSSLGSPSSPSQSPYFTPGVSSASSVESSNDGSDPRVRPAQNVSAALGHTRLPSGLGLRPSDRLSLVMIRTRDKGMSVDCGLERRPVAQSYPPDKKKPYSPYLVSQQVACAKGCGKVTAKCVKCGAASKTKMQRSQSLAKPTFSTTIRRSMLEPGLVLNEDAEGPESLSLGESERNRVKARLINASHQSIIPIAAEFPLDKGADPDASSWPPYPFRPS